jgi:hypothetical protein
MEGDRVAFSQEERDWLKALHGCSWGSLKQKEAKRPGLSPRQVVRLFRRIKKMGAKGLIHALRAGGQTGGSTRGCKPRRYQSYGPRSIRDSARP